MTHSYRTEDIISQYIGRKGVQIPLSVKKKKTVETMHVDPNNTRSWSQRAISVWDGYYYYY